MHRKMFGSVKVRILGARAVCVAMVGGGFAAASLASASSSSGLCATNGTRVVRYFSSCPAGSFPISFPAGTTVVVPPPVVTIVAPPVLAAGETAPTLAQNSGVVLTKATVPLAWSGATPQTGKTITGYDIRGKQANDATWSDTADYTNVSTVDYLVGTAKSKPIAANTAYNFEVRAEYGDGTSFGPWSNALAVTTPAA